ncbi:MAG: hypothetical protein Q8N28_02265 [bacterium]|nr:hypothetical protein [bacterium]
MKHFNKPFAFFTVIGLVIGLSSIFNFTSFAQTEQQLTSRISPQIYITEIKSDYGLLKGGDKITGKFVAENRENSIIELKQGINLFKIKTVSSGAIEYIEEKKLIDYNYDLGHYSFLPKQISEIDFSYVLPLNIPSGEYLLEIFLANNEFTPFAWNYLKLGKISGNDNFIFINELSVISQNGEEYPALVGVKFEPDKTPTLKIKAVLSGKNQISALYQIKVYDRMPWNRKVYDKIYEQKAIVFEPNKNINLIIDLPIISIPGSYAAEIFFLDEKNERISEIRAFRWVISGEAGRILFAKIDKNNYKAGQIADLEVFLADRPDLVSPGKISVDIWPLGEINLKAKIICEEGEIGAKETVANPYYQQVVKIEVPIVKDGNNCGAVVSMAKGDSALHQYVLGPKDIINKYQSLAPKSPTDTDKKISIPKSVYIVLIVILLLGVSLALLLKFKNKKFSKKIN